MWPHFVNLLSQTWSDLVLALGTTTLAIVLFSVCVPVVIWFATVISRWWLGRRSLPPMTFGSAFRESALSAVFTGSITMAVWLVIFGCFAIRTVYRDHQGLVNTVKKDVDIISKLQNQPKPVCPTGKPCVCPPGKPCEAVQEQPNCRIANYHYRIGDDTRRWVTVAMIYCNHDLVAKQEAPLNIGLQFDKNVNENIGIGLPGVLDKNQVLSMQQGTNGKRYSASLTIGYVPAYSILAITVAGDANAEGFPTAIGGGIEQAKAEAGH
jgi:hypothetical protein